MHRLAPVDLCDDWVDLSVSRWNLFLAMTVPLEAHFLQPAHTADTHRFAPSEETFEVIPLDYQYVSVKRRRVDEDYDAVQQTADRMNGALLRSGTPRTFLTVQHSAYVYHTEEWKTRGCNMYLPLTQDVMLNVRRVEQISFENDQFFLADGKGNYAGAKTGNAVHLWKMDPSSRKLYISRSLLFLRDREYRDVQQQLASL